MEHLRQQLSPGIRTSAQAMWNQAAMLPAVEIKKPESILAKRPFRMQAGIVFDRLGRQSISSRR